MQKLTDGHSVKVVAIVPWLAILFAIPLTVVTFMALSRAPVNSSLATLSSTPPSGEVGGIEKAPSSEKV